MCRSRAPAPQEFLRLSIPCPPADLIELSHWLGDPAQDCAIIGEGNTSARADAQSFWIKASGTCLGTMSPRDFVRVSTQRVLDLLDAPPAGDAAVLAALRACRADGPEGPLPSVETAMHAALLSLPGVAFVGHCHPAAVNMLACSDRFEEAFGGRLFPDHVVLCGPASVLVPYVDPGLPLAREVRARAAAFLQRRAEAPRTIYLQNHGFIALGATAGEVRNTTAMAVKAARILVGAYAAGTPRFLPDSEVARIHGRPDEHYRQRVFESR